MNQSSNGVSSNGSLNNGNNQPVHPSSSNNSNNNNSNNGNYNQNTRERSPDARLFTSGQKDILRLIGQHLRNLGLDKTTEILIKESGCILEHPIAVNFCNLIMNGEWEEAERALDLLVPIMEESGII